LRAGDMLSTGGEPVYASGDCVIDLARRELQVQGAPVPVGGRAFEIIQVLAQSAGELVSKDELMQRVWPGAIVNDNALQVHISAVRKSLGRHRTMLKTESGRGYRLLGSWTVSRPDAARSQVGPRVTEPSEGIPPSNIPLLPTPLVGRAAAAAHLRELASAYRVVTLTGPRGIGKTALAIEVAHRILAEFGDGGRFVELGSLTDPDLVPSEVARVLGLKLGGEEIGAAGVARTIGGRNLLLILDNCEHVIDTAAGLVEMIVRLCPHTTILATSREVLRIEGEHVYRVPRSTSRPRSTTKPAAL
jgi:DNA-binding winged helix-turn-helix (wHTH) protein